MKKLHLTLIALIISLTSFAIAPITGAGSVCAGSTLPLADATPGGTWSSSSTLIATIGSGTGVVTGAGAGTATITYTVGGGYVTATVTVNSLPTVYAIIDSGFACSGAGAGYTHITLTGSDAGISYSLDSAGIPVIALPGTGAPLNFGYHTGNSYTIIATGSGGCTATMTPPLLTTIVPTVTPAVSVSASPGATVTAGATVTFTAIGTNGGTAPIYIWEVNGMVVSSTSATYSYMPFNEDSVSLCMVSNARCAAPDAVCAVVAMHVIAPGIDGTQQITSHEKISVYPNPATDELTIKTGMQIFNALTITNNVGQVLIKQGITGKQTTVNINTLPAGMYYITLHGETGSTVQKFVKM